MPEYLAWYINQAPVQEDLHTNGPGAARICVDSPVEFTNLTVEVPDLETQKKTSLS